MQGIGTKSRGMVRLVSVAGLLFLHGCTLFEVEPEPVEPIPEIVVEPEPVVAAAGVHRAQQPAGGL